MHHLLHWERRPAGPREEMLHTVSSSTCATFQGSQESSSRRLRPPSTFRGRNHLLLASSSTDSLSSQRSLQRERGVQVKIIPVSSNRRQPALLEKLFRHDPREPVRSTIYCPLHRHTGNHRLGLGVGTDPRDNEIERWMVVIAKVLEMILISLRQSEITGRR